MPKDKKKICFYFESLYGGGAERSMLSTAIGFKERGYEVDLFLISDKGPYRKEVPDGIRIIKSGIYRFKLTLFISLLKFIFYIFSNKPCAIISALSISNIQLMIAKIITRTNAKCIMTIRNIEDPCSLKLKKDINYIRRKFISKLHIHLSKKADRIVTVSRGLSNYVMCNYPASFNRVTTIYNPINANGIILKSYESVDDCFFKNKKNPLIISSGRLHPDKNYQTLIRSIKKVHQKKLVQLIILGDGESRNELQELILSLGLQEYILMPGFIDNPFAYMGRADVFVLSSDHEGFGRVLVEAMACGCPVVSTDCPSGPREILEDGKWGYLVPVGDIDAMAEAIIQTIDDPIPKELLIARAKYFSIERAIDEYERVISA